ncbi:MAG TPA: cobaltochelatase subunit CobN, partial [Pirellulales bacterium]|nr:cobaltochelatase subunit CobN [Pirellulales bacterium]
MMASLRTRVLRMDGKLIYVAQKRAHLFVCAKGCCCGRTDRGHAAVPVDFYKDEYKRRRLRSKMQLSMNGCLGPCSMANAVLLVFDGRSIWFQSINHPPQIVAVYDYIDSMFAADRYLPPPAELAEYVFEYYLWSSTGCEVPAAPAEAVSAEVERTGICILSHADTDLLSLHHAARSLPPDFAPVQVVSLGKVKSAEHIEALIAGPVRRARVIVVRLLGGLASLPGFERLRESAARNQQTLIVVSGTGSLDPELTAASNVPPAVAHHVAAYLLAGGRQNAEQLLRFLSDHALLTGLGYEPAEEQPLHGIYHPDLPSPANVPAWLARHSTDKPTIGLLFYRAHWMSGNLAFVDALVREIESRGRHALPVFTSSLKELAGGGQQAAGSPADWPAAFEFFRHEGRVLVDVVVNSTSFSMADVHTGGPTQAGWAVDALRSLDVPILQTIACSTARWQWEASARGLNPLDTAMNVALPEFDGRVITVPVTFKERVRDSAT